MHHLLKTAVNPTIGLDHALHHWDRIARRLAEPPRNGIKQIETLRSLTIVS